MNNQEDKEKIGLVISIGTTPTPIIKALEDAKKERVSNVYFLYGRSLDKQEKEPLDVLNILRAKAMELGFKPYCFEVSDPEDFNSALKEVKEIVIRVKEEKINKLICNFTGGTKPMSAALVHGFLCEPLSAELYLDYIGGALRDESGRVKTEGMKEKRIETRAEMDLKKAVELINIFDYNHAYYLTRYFPEEGSLGFVKTLSEALWKWDNFHYRCSLHTLKRLREPAKYMKDDQLLSPLTKLITRVTEELENYCKEITKLAKIQSGKGDYDSLNDNSYLIPAEALNNAKRRLLKGEFSEAVLRTYRAIETAIQIKLLMKNINPWKVNLDKLNEEDKENIRKEFSHKDIPNKVALNDGFKILKALGTNLPADMGEKLREVQQTRNDSYLEHGYQKVTKEQADKCYSYGVELINALLEVNIEDYKSKIDLKME